MITDELVNAGIFEFVMSDVGISSLQGLPLAYYPSKIVVIVTGAWVDFIVGDVYTLEQVRDNLYAVSVGDSTFTIRMNGDASASNCGIFTTLN